MPAVRQGFYPAALLPDDLRGALRRRAQELGGLALIAVAGSICVALPPGRFKIRV
jgi:hypothetical protein